MIRYVCDWCEQEFPLNEVSKVKVSNVYSRPVVLHICREDARKHMPKLIQPMASWTAS